DAALRLVGIVVVDRHRQRRHLGAEARAVDLHVVAHLGLADKLLGLFGAHAGELQLFEAFAARVQRNTLVPEDFLALDLNDASAIVGRLLLLLHLELGANLHIARTHLAAQRASDAATSNLTFEKHVSFSFVAPSGALSRLSYC